MKFAVIEIIDGTKQVVEIVESMDLFVYTIKQQYTSANNINGLTIQDIEKYDYFNSGLYILTDNNIINLVEKYSIVNRGLFFNSTSNKVNLKRSWEIIPFK